MGDADYLILLYSADCTTILMDPIGPSPYEPNPTAGGVLYRNHVAGWRSINLGPRANEAGSGTFTANATVELLEALTTPQARVAVIREPEGSPSAIEMAGPIEDLAYTYQAARDGTDGLGVVEVQFADDLAALAERTVYPTPSQPSTAQTATKYTITNVNAEDAARTLVAAQAGTGALVGRRFPELVLGPDNGVGTTISTSFTRSVILTDALREILRLGGNLGMRTYQQGEQVRFEVYAPRNLSTKVWFSKDMGNIRELSFELAAPTATAAIVGDDQAGIDRVVKERTNAAALAAGWRRQELWVDARSAANATELEQAGDEALTTTGPTSKVSVVAIETPQQRYRQDFGINDRVSVEVFDGFVITDIVRGVDITVTPERGEVITPLIGAAGDADIDLKAVELTRLRRRMAQLEGAL